MVKVSVKSESGRYFVALDYPNGHRFLGEEFLLGKPVEGRDEGGQRDVERDAADWRAKLAAAGIKTE